MTVARLERLRSRMAEQGLDALVVAKPENRAYLSGFTGSAAVLLVTRTGADLLTDFRYTEQAASQAPHFAVRSIAGTTNHALVADLIHQHGGQRIGFEGDFLTFDEYGLYRKALEGRELVTVSGLVENLRLIKDSDEQAIMRKAAEVTDQAWAHILGYIKPGVQERDLAVELEYKMRKLGAEGPAFDTIVASGIRSSLPHGRASEKVVEHGDFVTFDFGALYQGYCADFTRTVVVGEPSAKQREIYEIVLEAQLRGLAACKAGATGQQVDAACRDYITAKGYGSNFGHGTGHGVGRFIHEGPRLRWTAAEDILVPGMMVTIEPGIYLPGWGGVRIEDLVLVTENGCERFSQSPKDLIIL